MTCVLLVGGHGTRLEDELADAIHSHYNGTDLDKYFRHQALGVPKALLPSCDAIASNSGGGGGGSRNAGRGGCQVPKVLTNVTSGRNVVEATNVRGGATILDQWWQQVSTCSDIKDVLLVSNADKFKHFERWATSRGFPLDNLLNTGSTASSDNSRGAANDVDLALRTLDIRNKANKAAATSAASESVSNSQSPVTAGSSVGNEAKKPPVPNQDNFKLYGTKADDLHQNTTSQNKPFSTLAEPIIIIAADTATTSSFHVSSLVDFYKTRNKHHHTASSSSEMVAKQQKNSIITCYTAAELPCHNVGLVSLDPATKEVLTFVEGVPSVQERDAQKKQPHLIAAPIYLFTRQLAVSMHRFCREVQGPSTIGKFVMIALGRQHQPPGGGFAPFSPTDIPCLLGVRLPSEVQLIGSRTTTLQDYEQYLFGGTTTTTTTNNNSSSVASQCGSLVGDVTNEESIPSPTRQQLIHSVEDNVVIDGASVSAIQSSNAPLQHHNTTAIKRHPHHGPQAIRSVTCRSWARVGLMGNPSDNFNGKCVSLTVRNFGAEVTCFESDVVCLMPHPLYDPASFGNLRDLLVVSQQEGYMGGLRLLQATCKRFVEACAELGVVLPNRNFTLRYETNVPRQVGLAGSSCIVSACIKALMDFYELDENDFPKEIVPSLVLSVEVQELGIHAGLQDRVAQMYEGLVAMDFEKQFLDTNGFGRYEQVESTIAAEMLPDLYLAYAMDPSDSGKIHSDVKQRWLKGDAEVVQAARSWAGFAEQVVDGIKTSTAIVNDSNTSHADRQRCIERFHEVFASLMDQNFELRRKLYGDQCLGWKNLRMIEIAREYNSAAKFPGSGGAILVCPRKGKTDVESMRHAYEAENFVLIKLDPHLP